MTGRPDCWSKDERRNLLNISEGWTAARVAPTLDFPKGTVFRAKLHYAAEIEFSVLARACLQGCNADENSLVRAINACVSERNTAAATIDCRFTAGNAEAKLRRLYPDTSALTQS